MLLPHDGLLRPMGNLSFVSATDGTHGTPKVNFLVVLANPLCSCHDRTRDGGLYPFPNDISHNALLNAARPGYTYVAYGAVNRLDALFWPVCGVLEHLP